MTCSFTGKPCGPPGNGCGACSIMQSGFLMKYAKPTGAYFGRGIYTTSGSSSACRYAKKAGSNVISGAVFVCGVACGKAEVLQGASLTDPSKYNGKDDPTPGYDSRIVNSPHDAQIYIDHANQYGQPLIQCD